VPLAVECFDLPRIGTRVWLKMLRLDELRRSALGAVEMRAVDLRTFAAAFIAHLLALGTGLVVRLLALGARSITVGMITGAGQRRACGRARQKKGDE
jgi:hypothetical protein